MTFINEEEILANSSSPANLKLRRDALEILGAALESADPEEAVRRALAVDGDIIRFSDIYIDLTQVSRIFVMGGGKAGVGMAQALVGLLGGRIHKGYVSVPHGSEGTGRVGPVTLGGASHPVPDESSVRGAAMIASIADEAGEGDLVIVAISGGGSSLMTLPAQGVTLEDARGVTEALLRSGANIDEFNAVRKHISAFKGGQLARRAHPARVISLILSDVVGDSLGTIASGPTSPDPTTFQDAINVLQRHGLWEETPPAIRERLKRGAEGGIPETPKAGDAVFENVRNVIIGSNAHALKAAAERAESLGYHTEVTSWAMTGEAREAGSRMAEAAKHHVEDHQGSPLAFLYGGETVVKVKGKGTGGRNQELALSAAPGIRGLAVTLAALSTDGVDGPTDAAGAVVDGSTISRAHSLGLDPERSLEENDSNTFFSALGDAIVSGPTGTNVNDVAVILIPPATMNACGQ